MIEALAMIAAGLGILYWAFKVSHKEPPTSAGNSKPSGELGSRD